MELVCEAEGKDKFSMEENLKGIELQLWKNNLKVMNACDEADEYLRSILKTRNFSQGLS